MKPCMMRDLFATQKIPANDEEYAKQIRSGMKLSYVGAAFGILLLALSVANEMWGFVSADSFMDGVYSGVGTGIAMLSVLGFLKSKRLLKDKNALHQKRVERYDERRLEITQKAVSMTYTIFIALLFSAMLIAGFFNRMIFWCCWSAILLLALVFVTVSRYYNSRM